MKKITLRIMAMLFALVMMFSFASTALAVSVELESTEYYTLSYDSDSATPAIKIAVDAEKLGGFLSNHTLNKAELAKFLPAAFAGVLSGNGEITFDDVLTLMPDVITDVLKSNANVTSGALSAFAEELAKFIPASIVEQFGISEQEYIADPAKFTPDYLKSTMKKIFKRIVLGEAETVDVTVSCNGADYSKTVFVSDDVAWTVNFNDMIALAVYSVPTVDTLASVSDGQILWAMDVTIKYFSVDTPVTVHFEIVLDGDTTDVNQYAEKLSYLVYYNTLGDSSLRVDIADGSQNSPVSFKDILDTLLTTDALTADEKVAYLSIFSKKGTELMDALAALNFEDVADSWIKPEYVPYLVELRDKAISFFNRLMVAAPGYYAEVSLADIYDVNRGAFIFNDTLEIETEKVLDDVFAKLGIDSEDFYRYMSYDKSLSFTLSATLAMADVYRVRYYAVDGSLLYTAFLPAGADLTLLHENVPEIIGKDVEGWKNENADVVNVMPEKDIDLFAAKAKRVYTATFVADGEIVAKVTFTEGDTKLTNVPRVPQKEGYYAKWEQYTLSDRDLVIEAIYTATTYTVRFDANGGEGIMAIQILVYDDMEYLNANTYTREGYAFAGWNTKADGTGYTYVDKALVRNLTNLNGIVLYAMWEKTMPDTHTVTFVADGKVVETVHFDEGDTELSRVPAVPAKPGYTGVWEEYTLGTNDITVNAKYTANSYIISFDANGGEGTMVAQSMTYDVLATLNQNIFTRDGYVFLGWNTKANGTGISYADGSGVQNVAESGTVVLYAQWKEVVEESTTDTTETTPTETTAVPEPPVDDSGFPWVAVIIGVASFAAVGGVVAYLLSKKKVG